MGKFDPAITGPLILAIVAVIALLWPSIIKHYYRPKFKLDFIPLDFD